MAEQRLIDANALPMYKVKVVHAFGIVEGSVVFPDDIKNAPTIDAAPHWISVEERLPGKCEYVLCIVRYGEDAWAHELGFVLNGMWYTPGKSTGVVTHWMPLPEPPKEEQAQ